MRSWLVTSATLIYVMASGLALVSLMSSHDTYDALETGAMGDDRNETSTPRNFILPASPALVLEGEARLAFERRMACLNDLRAAGIDVADEASLLHSKVISELRVFQKNRGLPVNGLLDAATIKVLGC